MSITSVSVQIPPPNNIPFKRLFRYASWQDYVMMAIGSGCAIAHGTSTPLFAVLLGNLVNALSNSSGSAYELAKPYAGLLFALGAAAFVTSAVSYAFWSIAAQKQVKLIREEYLRAVLKQEIGWWDQQSPGELASRLAADSEQIQVAIGTNIPACLNNLSRFITGITIGFVYGWQLALVVLAVVPVVVLLSSSMGKIMVKSAMVSAKAFASSGAIAEEVITSIRTVAAFNGERQEQKRFDAELVVALEAGEKRAKTSGVIFGIYSFVGFASYALSFWFGAQLIAWGTINARTGLPYTGGDVLSTFFGVMMSAFSLGQISPYIPSFVNGRAAGVRIFSVIDRVPLISSQRESDLKKIDSLDGEIEFRNVKFAYPTRPENVVLNDCNLKIKAGSTVALVGESGSGKSTCVALIERFYDPMEGEIIIDGAHNLKDLSLSWWRKNVALVGQMPILFHGSIRDNVKFGNPDALDEDMFEACKLSNAHRFIEELPHKYDTVLGGFGSDFLSGGQKQRIAIARALLKKPKILVLDEATSALDYESEQAVQLALDQIMSSHEDNRKMTCIVVAHRLSTVRNADLICAFKNGVIVERGSHEELLSLKGLYSSLVFTEEAKGNDAELSVIENSRVEIAEDILKCEKPLITEDRDQVLDINATKVKENFEEVKKPNDSIVKAIDEDVKVPLIFLWDLIKPHLPHAVSGITSSIVLGIIQPIFGLVISGMVFVFYKKDINQLKSEASDFGVFFVLVGIANFTFFVFQQIGIGYTGERMTCKIRSLVFESLLRQEISFYDDPKHSAGILVTRLNTDSEQIRKITTDWIGQILQILICALGGILIAYLNSWRLALLLTALTPFIVLSGLTMSMFLRSKDDKKALEEAGQISSEAISAIHTVVSFNGEETILKKFSEKLRIPLAKGIKSGTITGGSLGVSDMFFFAAYAGSFFYGAYLIDEGIASFSEVLRGVFCVVISFQSIGRLAERMPDIAKATEGLRAVYALISRNSLIDHSSKRGNDVQAIDRSIALQDVKFRYPSRPESLVLKNVNLEIKKGSTLALVGFSGSGKSTVIQMLLRFYDPASGTISMNGENLANLNVRKWRSHIGWVGQEAVLFNSSIRENIKYGNPDATDEQVIEAAEKANVMEFANRLQDGLDTKVGARGSQLSGGQRQRVAIARALVRDPELLLLDEATSALDNENEKLIQGALDKLMKNRTSVIIAHRLSTIQNADVIAFMSDGVIVESGTHAELLQKKGVFANLWATGNSFF